MWSCPISSAIFSTLLFISYGLCPAAPRLFTCSSPMVSASFSSERVCILLLLIYGLYPPTPHKGSTSCCSYLWFLYSYFSMRVCVLLLLIHGLYLLLLITRLNTAALWRGLCPPTYHKRSVSWCSSPLVSTLLLLIMDLQYSTSCCASLFVSVSLVIIKGTVRRDVTRVKNRLEQFVLTKYITASLYFLILKRHLHERIKKMFQRLHNNSIEVVWTLWLFPAKDLPVASI
jgi:hypothetical protein